MPTSGIHSSEHKSARFARNDASQGQLTGVNGWTYFVGARDSLVRVIRWSMCGGGGSDERLGWFGGGGGGCFGSGVGAGGGVVGGGGEGKTGGFGESCADDGWDSGEL